MAAQGWSQIALLISTNRALLTTMKRIVFGWKYAFMSRLSAVLTAAAHDPEKGHE
jgi:hypothetical protein